MPDDVYLTLDDNAGVAQVSRRRRVLVLGLPLLHILSERATPRRAGARVRPLQRAATPGSGPWIYRTRETIGRTVASLSADEDEDDWWAARLIRQPFIWYGRAFLRITAAISRRQEFAADALRRRAASGATRTSPASSASTLRPRLRRLLGGRGRPGARTRPPPAGLRRLPALHRPRGVEEAADRHLAATREVETDTYDSHPSLAERIAAIEDLPGRGAGRFAVRLRRAPGRRPRRGRRCSSTCSALAATVRARRRGTPSAHDVYGARAPERSPSSSRTSPRASRSPRCPTRSCNIGELARQGHRPRRRGPLRADRRACSATASWSRSRAPAGRSPPTRPSRSAPSAATTARRRTWRSQACAAGELDAATWRERSSELGIAELELGAAHASRRPTRRTRPRSTPGPRLQPAGLAAVAELSRRPGGLTPASTTAVHRCGFR